MRERPEINLPAKYRAGDSWPSKKMCLTHVFKVKNDIGAFFYCLAQANLTMNAIQKKSKSRVAEDERKE